MKYLTTVYIKKYKSEYDICLHNGNRYLTQNNNTNFNILPKLKFEKIENKYAYKLLPINFHPKYKGKMVGFSTKNESLQYVILEESEKRYYFVAALPGDKNPADVLYVKIICPKCNEIIYFNDKNYPAGIPYNIRCYKCKNIILVKNPAPPKEYLPQELKGIKKMIGKKYPYPNRKYILYKDRLEMSPIKKYDSSVEIKTLPFKEIIKIQETDSVLRLYYFFKAEQNPNYTETTHNKCPALFIYGPNIKEDESFG